MAVYTTDFSEFSLGTNIPGWTHRYNTGASTAEIVNTSFVYSMSGKALRMTHGASTIHALTCDALDNALNVEILTLGHYYYSYPRIGLVPAGRMGGLTSAPIMYTCRPWLGETPAYSTVYAYKASTSATTISSTNIASWYASIDTVSETNPIWIRFQIQGTTLRFKCWSHLHKEPTGWYIETVDSSISTGGWVGFFDHLASNGVRYSHYFAAATESESLYIPDTYNGDVYIGSHTKDNTGDFNDTVNQATPVCAMERVTVTRPNTYMVGLRGLIRWNANVTRSARMAVYVGGESDTDPTNATLVVDTGEVTTLAASAWNTFPLPGTTTAIELPPGRYWICIMTKQYAAIHDISRYTNKYNAWGLNSAGPFYYLPAPYDTGDTSVEFPTMFPAGAIPNTGTNYYLGVQVMVGPASNFGVVVPRTASYTESLTLSDSTRVSIQEPYFFYEDLATFKSQLANRLNDPDMIYWTSDELLAIIHEALRTLSLLTWYNGYRLECTPNGAFQNLYTIDPMRLGMTMTDREMINRMQYDLMENITADWISGWAGTDQFNLADLTHALQKRRNRFLSETGAVITRITNGDITLTNDGIIKIPDSIIDVRRVAWKDSVGYRNLWRVAEEEMTAFDPSWTTPAVQDPLYYSELAIKQAHMQLAPAPSALNDMELLTLSAGADFQPSLEATAMGVNDDMAWIVKWGALAEVLGGDNPAKDPERAAYCEKRYQHGLQMANNYTTIIAARIGDTPIQVVTLAELDAYNGDWQKATPGAPQMVATAGLNYVAFSPPADGSTTISLDITRTAQLPWGDSDFIQLGRELYSPVLDYCVHLAMFKVGGAEFQATMPLLENFFEMCSNYNKRMEACSRLWRDMDKVTNAEEMTRLRTKTMGEPRTPENWGYGKPGGKQ